MAINRVYRDDKNLCRTCRRASIASTSKGEMVHCGAFGRLMPALVTECSQHDDKTRPALYQMEQIAWVLVTDKSKKIGFKPNKEWRAENPRESITPED